MKLYEGKAKIVYKAEKDDEVRIYYKDDATAFNNVKKGTIENKGILNCTISSYIYSYLEKEGIPTHLVRKISDREQICKKVNIIPLEVITRNILAGSTAKLLGIEEGLVLNTPIFEICYKKDELGDPLINDSHAVALGIATKEELEKIYSLTKKINQLLVEFFLSIDIKLVDFKIEFGKDEAGNILLADEISPDCCRLWDAKTFEKLDKDRFRRDLGNVAEAYINIRDRIESMVR